MYPVEMTKAQTWQEKERLSKLYEEERKRNLQQQGLTSWVLESLKSENTEAKQQLDKLNVRLPLDGYLALDVISVVVCGFSLLFVVCAGEGR